MYWLAFEVVWCLGIFSGSVMSFSVVLELCALYLTAGLFPNVRVDSLGPI